MFRADAWKPTRGSNMAFGPGTTEPQIMACQTVAMILSGSLFATLQSSAPQSSAPRSAQAAAAVDTHTDSFACPVTVVNGGKGGLYANDSLEVVLWPESKFVFAPGGPGFVDRDGALGMKVGWGLRKKGSLVVTGRRLDGVAPPARAYIPRSYDDYVGGMSLFLVFPTPGCWEIMGSVADVSLTFVTLVEKIGEGPKSHLNGPPRGSRVSQ
jgi:hypothetical protein